MNTMIRQNAKSLLPMPARQGVRIQLPMSRGRRARESLISQEQVWMLVSYVRSLQMNKNVTTENVGGKTVERTGH